MSLPGQCDLGPQDSPARKSLRQRICMLLIGLHRPATRSCNTDSLQQYFCKTFRQCHAKNIWTPAAPTIPNHLQSRNRKWCRQTGSRQSTPLSTIRTRYGNSASTPGATRTGKNQQNSLQKRKPIRNFSIDPSSSIRTPIAGAIFADAISETPMQQTVTRH